MQNMFDAIAPSYDFLNHLLSFSIDKYWRREVVKRLPNINDLKVLDVSTGTGDMAISIAKRRTGRIVGIDISEKMLQIGAQKTKKKKLDKIISFQQADVADLPFQDNIFDACTVAFGVRNFERLEKGLSEMYRTLKPSAKVIILEFSTPEKSPFKQIYAFYSQKILPFIGKSVSKDKTAYSYLPDSVKAFPGKKEFQRLLSSVGFKEVCAQPYTFGIVTIYAGIK